MQYSNVRMKICFEYLYTQRKTDDSVDYRLFSVITITSYYFQLIMEYYEVFINLSLIIWLPEQINARIICVHKCRISNIFLQNYPNNFGILSNLQHFLSLSFLEIKRINLESDPNLTEKNFSNVFTLRITIT